MNSIVTTLAAVAGVGLASHLTKRGSRSAFTVEMPKGSDWYAHCREYDLLWHPDPHHPNRVNYLVEDMGSGYTVLFFDHAPEGTTWTIAEDVLGLQRAKDIARFHWSEINDWAIHDLVWRDLERFVTDEYQDSLRAARRHR